MLRELWGFVSTSNALAAVALTVALVLLVLFLRARSAVARQRTTHQAGHEELRKALAELERAHWQTQDHNVRLVKECDELADAVRRSRTQGAEVLANLAMRSLILVERQLGRLEGMENVESDSVRLDELYQLDHLATRMRRNSENMLLLAGGDHQRQARPAEPAPLLDVLRAALSEIERYERVHLTALPPLWVRPDLADDLSHLFAELLDNGTAFSPPTEAVTVTAWHLDSGELMVSVADRGIGMTDQLLREVNAHLAAGRDDDGVGPGSGRSLGLRVVTLLAHRHSLRVQLRQSPSADGVTALVALPATVLVAPPAEPEPASFGQPASHRPHSPAGPTSRPRTGPTLTAVPGARSATPGTRPGAAGLPKRVPGESGQLARPANSPDSAEAGTTGEPHDRGGASSAADELRRRLGGFQNGLRAAAAPRGEEDKG
ncbi:ATP-binding protein [Streptacidiphilus sp. MAP12-20]|uniref:sensor histidine kinase n=1 Tax=Streptacidiphilus sp. MAP12-20 TaxID=3156299 RepID=UPI003513E4AD